MIAPALMYALYNNLTFNNLKAFDANVFQVKIMLSAQEPRMPMSVPPYTRTNSHLLRPPVAHERANRDHRRVVLRPPVPPPDHEAVPGPVPPPRGLQVTRAPRTRFVHPLCPAPLRSVASAKGSVTMPSLAMVAMVFVQATLSSLSSVYIEKLLKVEVFARAPTSPTPPDPHLPCLISIQVAGALDSLNFQNATLSVAPIMHRSH